MPVAIATGFFKIEHNLLTKEKGEKSVDKDIDYKVSEYANPDLYDIENNAYVEDIPLLLKWAKKLGGTVIELACGTGRVTIPLALANIPIIGVDLSEPMLGKAREKAREKGLDITWLLQDCTNLQLNTKSSLIYLVGNSFQHFLTNDAQDQLLQSVHANLQEDGVFIFDTRFPSKEELMQPETEEYWRTYRNEAGEQVDVYTIASYDQVEQIQHYTTIRKTKKHEGWTVENRTYIDLRYTYPQELKRLLANNGFEILHLYCDWEETPLTEESYSMICVCRKK